jgi:nucleotide-binding universal stress UspA family protein
MPTTVLHLDYASADLPRDGAQQAERTKAVVAKSAEAGDEAVPAERGGGHAEITTRVEDPREDIIAAEAKKGYGLLLIGREPASEGDAFHEQITQSAAQFAGPIAIAIARGVDRLDTPGVRLNILVSVTGTSASRHGAEVAIALAQASRGSVTALHVASGQQQLRSWGRQVGAALAPRSSADAILREIVRLGDRYGIDVKGVMRRAREPAKAILRQLEFGSHTLLVVGVSARPGDQLTFGQVAAELLDRAECSVLFVADEALAATAAQAGSVAETAEKAAAMTPVAA